CVSLSSARAGPASRPSAARWPGPSPAAVTASWPWTWTGSRAWRCRSASPPARSTTRDCPRSWPSGRWSAAGSCARARRRPGRRAGQPGPRRARVGDRARGAPGGGDPG
ncbi:MAG: hypothetical protein AVDCRST_MAG88-3129, partial [uncultured Thermomicrobiales bacterium]